MRYLGLTVLIVLGSLSLYADDEDLITHGHGQAPHRTEAEHHPVQSHPSSTQNQIRHDVNRDLRNSNWNNGGYGGGYVLPAPNTVGDPLSDPNDDMNQIYKQNQQNMERTGH